MRILLDCIQLKRPVVYDHFRSEVSAKGEEKIICPGGRGGKGNNFFKTSTLQTPRFAQPGEPGKEEWKVLELKLLADVGLVLGATAVRD